MRVASFGLLALGLMLCVGFALAGALPTLAYEKPVAGLADSGLKIQGESSSVSCGVFECVYKFKVLETAGVSSSLNVLPYFTDSKASIVSFKEVKEKQVVSSWEECQSWVQVDTGRVDDKNGGKIFDTVCSKWLAKQSVETVLERLPVAGGKGVFVKNSKLAANLTQKDYLTATINANSERVFEIVFRPSSKTGELVIVANDSVNTLKIASLDPWWNTNYGYQRQLTLTDNVTAIATDLNTLVRVELPLSTWAHKPLANCNDLRVVYNDTTELDRNLFVGVDYNAQPTNCQTQDVNLFFNLNAALTGSDSTNYKVYYGNAAATAPSDALQGIDNYALKDSTVIINGVSKLNDAFNGSSNFIITDNNYVSNGVSGKAAGIRANATDTIMLGGLDYAAMGASLNLPYTIQFWLAPYRTTAARSVIWSFDDGAGDNTVALAINNGEWTYRRWTGASMKNCVYSGTAPVLKKWIHVAMTWSSDAGLTLYLNGVQVCNAAAAGTGTGPTAGATFGFGKSQTGDDGLEGLYDNFQFVNEIRTAFPTGDVNSTAFQVSGSVGDEIANIAITANFLTALDRNYFDAANGLTTVVGTFTDASTKAGNNDINGWHWDINGVNAGNDQNFVHNFTAVGDYNITLRIDGNTGLTSSHSYIISLLNLIQGLTISVDNASIASYDSNVQFDLNGSYTGSADAFWFLKNGSIIGSGSSGLHRVETSAGDINYCFIAQTTGTDVNKQACTSLKVTRIIVKIPLDEQEPTTQVKPFDISIDTNTTAVYSDINVDVNAWFAGTTILTKNIYVADDNGDYFGRYYGVSTDGTTQTLQPYLLKKSGSGNVIFYVKSQTTGTSVYGAKITLKKIISRTKTIMEEQYSDASGVVNFIMVYNDTYYIDANYLNMGFTDYLLRPNQASYTIWLSLAGAGITDYSAYGIDANYLPNALNIKNEGNIITGLKTTAFANGLYINWARLRIISDDNVLYDYNTTGVAGSPWRLIALTIPSINIGGLTSGKDIIFDWNIRDVRGTYYSLQHNITYLHTGSIDFNANIAGVRNGFGQTGSIFIALIAVIIICGLAAYGGFGNASGLAILGGMVLLIFAYFNFVPWALAIIACIGGFGLYYLQVRQ